MEQLNKIELRGNVGFTKVLTVGDKRVLRLSVATNYVYKGKNGEPVIETTWHYISAWENKFTADFSKIVVGSKVYVLGRLRSQRYLDNEGNEKFSYEIIANQLSLIE